MEYSITVTFKGHLESDESLVDIQNYFTEIQGIQNFVETSDSSVFDFKMDVKEV
jgi:hypothetical protein